jgi:hypothetical protein
MAPRYQIVKAVIPPAGIAAFRSLSRGDYLEPIITPKFADAFETWLKIVAVAAQALYPRRSGRSAAELPGSVRVRVGSTLESIQGYFLVNAPIAGLEYGPTVTPKNARKIAIPLPEALRADGTPKRIGPNSWRPLGTFVYTSKRTGQMYIAYNRKGVLHFLYLLVDRAKLPELRTVRNAYDSLIPRLYGMFADILRDSISEVYSRAFNEAQAAILTGNLPRLPPRPPDAVRYSQALAPSYKAYRY